jgi:CO dehydrogenase maturation factor
MARSIAVAGKGGTGKTTIAALTVLHLLEKKMGPVLAIDADPDSNLGTLLGIKVKQSIGDLREDVLEEIKNFPPGMSKASYVEAGLHQIIDEEKGYDLITMGKGEGAGCYCYLNSLIRKFSEDLWPSYNWVVMDNEAGLEHISRRTTYNIDALLVVVSENPISVATAKNIEQVTKRIKNEIRKKYVITNMVKPNRRPEIQKRIEALDMEYLGDVPFDPQLEEHIFLGKPLSEMVDSEAQRSIQNILNRIGGTDGNT